MVKPWGRRAMLITAGALWRFVERVERRCAIIHAIHMQTKQSTRGQDCCASDEVGMVGSMASCRSVFDINGSTLILCGCCSTWGKCRAGSIYPRASRHRQSSGASDHVNRRKYAVASYVMRTTGRLRIALKVRAACELVDQVQRARVLNHNWYFSSRYTSALLLPLSELLFMMARARIPPFLGLCTVYPLLVHLNYH
jgi:hypothetical protein